MSQSHEYATDVENPFWRGLERLEGGEKWIKSSLVGRDGTHCLLGALANTQSESDWKVFEKDPIISDAVEQVVSIIFDQFPDLLDPDDYPTHTERIDAVWEFNDDPNTTFDDVRSVLEKAAIRFDEKAWDVT